MNVLVSCDYQDGSAAGTGKSLVWFPDMRLNREGSGNQTSKSLAMCFGAIVALSKVLKSVSSITSLSFHQDRWLP